MAGTDQLSAVFSALFISIKTVADHLTRIYAKLGVRSRGELARRINTGDNDP